MVHSHGMCALEVGGHWDEKGGGGGPWSTDGIPPPVQHPREPPTAGPPHPRRTPCHGPHTPLHSRPPPSPHTPAWSHCRRLSTPPGGTPPSLPRPQSWGVAGWLPSPCEYCPPPGTCSCKMRELNHSKAIKQWRTEEAITSSSHIRLIR